MPNPPVELKPCPSCLANASLQFNGRWADPHFVRCHVCGLSTDRSATEAEAIERWNRRPIEDALTAERDEWHKDRDHWLDTMDPWMKMVEAVYPDKELDFGEALAQIIEERSALTARVGVLEEALKEAHDISTNTEELNMSNYDHQLVEQLNNGMIEVHQILDAASTRKGDGDEMP